MIGDGAALLRHLGACFAWEYANQEDVRLVGGRTVRALELRVETLAGALAAHPALDATMAPDFLAHRRRLARACTVVHALFPVTGADGAELDADGVDAGRAGNGGAASPLLVAELDEAHLERDAAADWDDALGNAATFGPTRPAMRVNRALVSRLGPSAGLDGSAVERLCDALQDIVDGGILDRRRTGVLLERLGEALPALRPHGFEAWPMLVRFDPDEPASRIHCAASLLLVRRSRQSMGVLHEVAALARLDGSSVSAPLRALIGGGSRERPAGRAAALAARARRRVAPRAAVRTQGLSGPQRRAVAAASSHALGVVVGPPGTGKTHTLAAIATACVAAGGSVLVCARTDAAVDVAERFLVERSGLGEAVLRGGDTAAQRRLRDRLEAVLRRGGLDGPAVPGAVAGGAPDATALGRAHRAAASVERRLARRLRALERRLGRAMAVADATAGPLDRLVHRLDALLPGRTDREVPGDAALARGALLDELARASTARLRLGVRRGVRVQLERDRDGLARLSRSLVAREHNQRRLQEEGDWRALTAVLPLWLGTLADLSRLLPLRRELFDLVLIDEASQIDAASALPALQRARRAVVFGDPAQLRHVSFLPHAVEAELLARELPDGPVGGASDVPGFRDDSLLDWASRRVAHVDAMNALDEHFRSAPAIIGFSNRAFYDDGLALLTRLTHDPAAVALELERVAGGARDRRGVNRREAERIVARCARIAADGERSGTAPSIGIVSPFRAQADHLSRVVPRALGAAAFERHDVRIGTAHELQGEERDVVLFSAAVDDTSPGGALAFLSRPDVLNVAITRAKRLQVVFLSRSPQRFDPTSLFGRYLEWVASCADSRGDGRNGGPSAGSVAPSGPSSDAVARVRDVVADVARGAGCTVELDVRVGRIGVDVVLRRDGRVACVDVVGPGAHALRLDEHDVLRRAGVQVLVVTAGDDADATARRVRALAQGPTGGGARG